jgi:Holliday junction DNA helicase RuvA
VIAIISGTVVSRSVTHVEVLTAGGVGYDIAIPLALFEQLPADGEPITVHTHLAVREDVWELYGFSSRYERAVFRRLLSAKGVGPALALGIISAIGAERVVHALRQKDIGTLVRVPRVGRKKAEQIVLDLADKMDDLAIGAQGTVPTGSASTTRSGGAPVTDAVRALVALGYPEADAHDAVRSAGVQGDVAATVRAALALLND